MALDQVTGVPGSRPTLDGSGVHWEGPETTQPTSLDAGPVEDGILEATNSIFGLHRNVGSWTAHFVLGIDCREEVFFEDLQLVVEWEEPR